MNTLFSIGLLIVMAIIANFVIVFALNIAGFPGALLAGKPGQRSKRRFVLASVVAALGQSFVYLAYTAFIVSWTTGAVLIQGVSMIIWPVAFLAVVLPLWINLIRARVEDKGQKYGNAQVEALHLTFVFALIGFFLFALAPKLMEAGYGWLPYI